MVGLGLYLGLPNGRPRSGSSGGATERRLAGTIRVIPEIEATGLQISHELVGAVDVDPRIDGALNPMRILYGNVDVDPGLSANLQRTIVLRGTVDVNPALSGDIEEVMEVTLSGVIDVDPLFSAEMDEPVAVYEGATLVMSTPVTITPGTSVGVDFGSGAEVGDLVVLITETPLTTPLTATDYLALQAFLNVGSAGNANACRAAIYAGYHDGTALNLTAHASADHVTGVLLVFRGALNDANLANVVKFLGTTQSSTGTTALEMTGSLDPTGPNRAIVVFSAHGLDSSANQATFGQLDGLADLETVAFSGTTAGNGGGVAAVVGYLMADAAISPSPRVDYSSSRPTILSMLEIVPAA
jgi:hypothetical protein